MEWVLYPFLFSPQVALGCAALVVLMARRRDRFWQVEPATTLSFPRAAVFVLLQGSVLAAAMKFMPTGAEAVTDVSLGGFLGPALRVLALLPALVLFPLPHWTRLVRAFRTEIIAALVVLLTFFPYRLSLFLWTHYQADLLASAVHACLSLFFSDAFYLLGDPPLLGTLRYPVSLIYGCSGIQGIVLFQGLFGLMVLWDWKRLIPQRALLLYVCGLAAMQAANLVRIVSLVAVGTFFPEGQAALQYHWNAGWIFFTVVFAALIAPTYHWMLGWSRMPPPRGAQGSPLRNAGAM